ncbi:Tad domain-containing protein [Pectobacterium brasiliense]|uniref:Tad domain-containing protein n=1 Tax=Pectobacterium brasiliense TaxID=180957 RepID=UPI00196934B7|nr:TadE/TadG family type IV pilus assembly protein [Pectobacterium brasiliense]MBN3121928.1 pilus assembly protein [Pectobacterium brasiliense]QSD22111.1 pilus assembly protein [Pectobacterium brasiliense]
MKKTLQNRRVKKDATGITLFWRERLSAFIQEEKGAGTGFYALGAMALLVTAAFIVDTSTATGDATQIKRATDAAALAVGHQATINGEEYSQEETNKLAYDYVKNNLGMNKALSEKLEVGDVAVTEGRNSETRKTYTVTVAFETNPSLLSLGARKQEVFSTAEVINRPTEVAFVMPVTGDMSEGDIRSLKSVSRSFVERMLSSADGKRDNLWLSLVPYSQSVSVYDAEDANRIRRWAAPGALNPPELRSLFASGVVSSMADRRFPDRRANLLCMYRGLGREENFFWDEPPVGQFKIYYRHDLPQNGSPGAPPISWRGPNPDFDDTDAVDTRWIVADRGCPNAALMPLTNEESKLNQRIDQFSARFNVNYAIGMSWAGAALSPNMRGSDGWGDATLPLDFNLDGNGDGQKVIVMMANTVGDWFDTDGYNFNRNAFSGQTGSDPARTFAAQRFRDLCSSFRARNIKFYFVGIRPGDPEDFGRNLFDAEATPGLLICTEGEKRMSFIDGAGFGAEGVEDQLIRRLDRIAGQIETEGGYVRLVE